MSAKPKEPQPSTHVAVPNQTWERLAAFLKVQPWENVDALIDELAASRVSVVVK